MPRWYDRKINLAYFSEQPKYYSRVKDVRLALAIRSATLARLLHIDDVTFLGYEENRTTELPLELFMDMSILTGLSADYLMGLTDEPAAYSPSLQMPQQLTTERIREYRTNHDITIKAMAERLDISRSGYCTKELHPETLSFTILDIVLIAYLLETSVDYLLHLTDELVPHKRGIHKRIPLPTSEVIRIRKKLHLESMCATTENEIHKYCLQHFRLKEIRLANNLRQKDVAEFLGINIMTYGGYEKKPHNIPAYFLIKLAKFYGCTIDYLVGSSDIF